MIPEIILPEVRALIQPCENSDCWIWTGPLNESGYGYIAGGGVIKSAHRAVWELLRGPIAEGLELHHHCRTPRCCNPAHLEPVTPEENRAARVVRPRTPPEVCRRGHSFDGKRTRVIGGRYCKVCININRKELKQRTNFTPE